MTLTRDSSWTLVTSVPIAFTTYHPQGLVKIGDTLFVSSVEVHDRAAGKGIGHLFKIDRAGNLLADLKLGEGAIGLRVNEAASIRESVLVLASAP